MHYYNENDDGAADWLENLIFAGEIPDGVVDRRSIEDVTPADLAGFTQCHFFAGIGGWPLALRIAGWPEDRPIWTGSCPCQPFSQAGKGAGSDDPRHLWPSFYWLIRQCRPAAVFGEQVASKDVDPWIDAVLADLEKLDYAGGAIAFPSAGVGAPHIRDRTYWMGYADDARLEGLWRRHPAEGGQREGEVRSAAQAGRVVRLGDADGQPRERRAGSLFGAQAPVDSARLVDGRQHHRSADASEGALLGLADAAGERSHWRRAGEEGDEQGSVERLARLCATGQGLPAGGPTNGMWEAADWLHGRDGKWRPVRPGTFPLAHGVPARVGRLRAYGNAINPWQAAEFIRAAEEARELIA